MPTTYEQARDAIADIIEAIPGIVEVHKAIPDSFAVEAMPAVVFTGYESRTLRPPGATKKEYFTVGLRLVVRESETGERMQHEIEALKQAITTAFDSHVGLSLAAGSGSVVEGPNWIQREYEQDGGSLWDEGEILIQITSAYAPVH